MNSSAHFQQEARWTVCISGEVRNTDLGVISIGVDGKQDRELSLMAKGLKI